jgi:hypothetical protein
MAIYGRCGQEVTILRKAVLKDVGALDKRNHDAHDRARISLGMYLVVDDHGTRRLYDYVYLRADGAWQEIDKAIAEAEEARKAVTMTNQELAKWYDAIGTAKEELKAEGDQEGVDFMLECLRCPKPD